jgi:hypothetical protein
MSIVQHLCFLDLGCYNVFRGLLRGVLFDERISHEESERDLLFLVLNYGKTYQL